MDTTKAILLKFLAALPAPGYDLGILSERGMYRLEAVSQDRILRMLPFLKHRNANGAHIYMRPTGESPYTLLDDLSVPVLASLTDAGYGPAAVVETSPGNFQAWLRHGRPLAKELGTLAAKVLAVQFGADTNAADWRRFGRAPGFTNRKLRHRNSEGLYPFTRLVNHSGQTFLHAAAFLNRLLRLQQQIKEQRAALHSSFASRPARPASGLFLSRFRTSPRYQGRPAAADLAFSIAAYSQGWSEEGIAAELVANYLSRNPSKRQKDAYIQRTIRKAIQCAS